MRTQPICTEISASGSRRAEDELGRAAADVDHQKRPVAGRRLGRRAAKRQPRLLVAAQAARAARRGRARRRRRMRRCCSASRAALVAAARTRARRGARSARRTPTSTATVRAMASGCSAPVSSTPWPSRVICIERSSSRPRVVGDRAGARSSCRCRPPRRSSRHSPRPPIWRFRPISVSSSMRAAASSRNRPCSLLVVVHEPGFFTPR